MHPQKETYWGNVNPIGPRACYDEAKRVAESMCYAYAKQVELPFGLGYLVFYVLNYLTT
jgi:nucleoside-diphosphate-sugar epimerase